MGGPKTQVCSSSFLFNLRVLSIIELCHPPISSNRERNGKAKVLDYNSNVNPFQLVLTGVWASGFTYLCYKIFEAQVLNK